ncbi:PIN domain nuclease [Deinococcus detaillensis]|uniref:PIN domain nuclease n=1 Tax=Deinococcus detaillensis TaxID=2592048 RepID=A0A553V2Z4_9DEIO|nr:PIN domain nuclease [Deinococcus detaillensis]TSA86849.1 PIN domain nuclease [Deinococcus detaillensis]
MGLKIKIQRTGNGGDTSSPSLWTVLTSGLFARKWLGRAAPRLPQLPLEPARNTLLYFRTRGCTVCGLIDMQVAAACHQSGVDLLIVDRYTKSDDPEDQTIYAQRGNILDFGGPINTAYQIGTYPSLVLINSEGKIVLKDVGNRAKPDVYGEYLKNKFAVLLG